MDGGTGSETRSNGANEENGAAADNQVRSGFGRATRARAGGDTRKTQAACRFSCLCFPGVAPALQPAAGRRRNRTSSPLTRLLRF